MNKNYFDVHSHLTFPDFDADREEIIARMKEEGVWTIAVGTTKAESQASLTLAEAHENIFATIGIHPTDSSEAFEPRFFNEQAEHERVVAIGECGLDYFREDREQVKETQERLFRAHIECALDHDLPLMIHARPSKGTMNAYEDVLAIVEEYRHVGKELRGNMHFFVGSVDIARRFLDIGWTLSFDGPITFTHDYDEVIRFAPLSMIMAETDAPFAAPVPFRGQRNSPLYVPHVVEAIARIREEDFELVKETLVANAQRSFLG